MRHDFRDEFTQTFELQNAREDASLVDRQFREIQDQFVQENVDAIARELRGEHKALLAGLPTIADTDCDRDSNGVSDPSGRARGHLGRAQRGRSRSRHGFLSLLLRRHWKRAAKSAARIIERPRAPRRSLYVRTEYCGRGVRSPRHSAAPRWAGETQ
jgi:hypothetical protein